MFGNGLSDQLNIALVVYMNMSKHVMVLNLNTRHEIIKWTEGWHNLQVWFVKNKLITLSIRHLITVLVR